VFLLAFSSSYPILAGKASGKHRKTGDKPSSCLPNILPNTTKNIHIGNFFGKISVFSPVDRLCYNETYYGISWIPVCPFEFLQGGALLWRTKNTDGMRSSGLIVHAKRKKPAEAAEVSDLLSERSC
jgi:hypothetical protein